MKKGGRHITSHSGSLRAAVNKGVQEEETGSPKCKLLNNDLLNAIEKLKTTNYLSFL